MVTGQTCTKNYKVTYVKVAQDVIVCVSMYFCLYLSVWSNHFIRIAHCPDLISQQTEAGHL